MKRCRRPLILITLFLLAGAVVNVAVAWVLVGAPTIGIETVEWSLTPEDRARVGRKVTWPPGWPNPEYMWSWAALGRNVTMVGYSDYRTVRVAGGWPLLSVRCDGMGHLSVVHNWESGCRISLAVPPLLQRGRWYQHPHDRLPLTPIPAGFAINTLFYTAILALPLSFFPIRRHLRARRGRCPKCGYDLAGLELCPECGAAS